MEVDRLVDADEEGVVRVVAGLEQALDPPLGDALALVLGDEVGLGRWGGRLVDAPMCIANLLLPCTDGLSSRSVGVRTA